MSKRTKKVEFAGSESELNAMTKELDELHNDVAVPSMWAGVSNMIDGMRGATGAAHEPPDLPHGDGRRRRRRCRAAGGRFDAGTGRRGHKGGVTPAPGRRRASLRPD